MVVKDHQGLCAAPAATQARLPKLTVVVQLRAVAAAHELIVHLAQHLGIDDGLFAALLPSPYERHALAELGAVLAPGTAELAIRPGPHLEQDHPSPTLALFPAL